MICNLINDLDPIIMNKLSKFMIKVKEIGIQLWGYFLLCT